MGARVLLRRYPSRKASKADQTLRNLQRIAKPFTHRAKWFNHAMNKGKPSPKRPGHVVATTNRDKV